MGWTGDRHVAHSMHVTAPTGAWFLALRWLQNEMSSKRVLIFGLLLSLAKVYAGDGALLCIPCGLTREWWCFTCRPGRASFREMSLRAVQGVKQGLLSNSVPFSEWGIKLLDPEHLGVFHTICKTISWGSQIPRSKRSKVRRNPHHELPAHLLPYAAVAFWSN